MILLMIMNIFCALRKDVYVHIDKEFDLPVKDGIKLSRNDMKREQKRKYTLRVSQYKILGLNDLLTHKHGRKYTNM